jgi:hypothetical protein
MWDSTSKMLKKGGWGGWDDPRARATRGLRRMRRERPGALLARRTRTFRKCSFDARSKGQPRPLPPMKGIRNRKALARANGTSRRASGWAGENDARSWDHPTHPLESDSSLQPCLGQGASLGEEAVLADSGRAGEVAARVGRVRNLDFLSILNSFTVCEVTR